MDPPNRLVHTMDAFFSEAAKAEPTSRVTWEIAAVGDSCRLVVTHDQLREGGTDEIWGGWPMILSGLKTWLESGELLTTPGSLRVYQGVTLASLACRAQAEPVRHLADIRSLHLRARVSSSLVVGGPRCTVCPEVCDRSPAATMVGAALVAVPGIAPTRSAASTLPYAYCPPARQIIGPHTHWDQHRLGPGISIAQANVGHRRHRLRINVVRADLRQSRVAVRPLRHSLTHRQTLPDLAHRNSLVAAANGPYFSFATGSPVVPVIGPRGPLVLTNRSAWLAGIGRDGRAEDGNAWLVGAARSATDRLRLSAINWAAPMTGLSVYTPAWGGRKVPVGKATRTIAVRHRAVIRPAGHRRYRSRGGRLLVANSPQAVAWMHGLRRGSRVAVHFSTGTDARSPFQQAYGVGTMVVDTPTTSAPACTAAELRCMRPGPTSLGGRTAVS